MERELIMTGIGGQGVQVATKALARAASGSGLKVMMFGMFGGSVRGGRSECTLVVSDDEIEAPPILSTTGSAVALHPKFWDPVFAKVRAGGLVLVNSSLMAVPDGARGVAMSEIAEELGNVGLVGMVALGAYAALSGMASIDAVTQGMRDEIPSYRSARIPENEAAIAKGAAAV